MEPTKKISTGLFVKRLATVSGGAKPAMRRKRIVIIGLAAASVATAALALAGLTLATDWAQFHFSANHIGVNPSESILATSNVSGLKQQWASSIGPGGESSPAVVNGTVYVGADDGKVYAFDAATGQRRWTAATGGAINLSSPAVADGRVYIGSTDQKVYAFDAATGSTLWVATTGRTVEAPPSVANGVVYAASDKLYAFDAATGATLWTADTGGPVVFSSPTPVNGKVFVGAFDTTTLRGPLEAFDSATGARLWTATTFGAIEGAPAVIGNTVYVASGYGVEAFDASSGSKLWEAIIGADVFTTPAVANDVVYVGGEDGKVYALNAATGRSVWTTDLHTRAESIDFSSPAVANGVVYVGSSDAIGTAGQLWALDAVTGVVFWSGHVGGVVYSSPAVVNGNLYVSADKLYSFGFGGPLDTTPPMIFVPGDITTVAAGSDWEVVYYTVSVTDDVDPNPSLSCTPPSGDLFPPGTTTVTCTARDSAGNTATASFKVTVTGAVPFAIEIVDASSGSKTSLALDPQGIPHISYISNGMIRHADRSGGLWVSEQVDSGPVDPTYGTTSLAIDSQGRPHVSYALSIVIGVGTQLKYAYKSGNGWVQQIVDSGAYVSTVSSLALDALDRPHICYLVSTGYTSTLYHAVLSGGTWVREIVSTVPSVSSGILRIGSDGIPRIAFKTGFPTVVQLATRQTNGTWMTEVVDASQNLVAIGMSFVLDANDHPHLSYADYNQGIGKYAVKVDAGWVVETSPFMVPGGEVTGLAVARDGTAFVCYVTQAPYFPFGGMLRLATRTSSGWNSDVVDSAPGPVSSCSLALDGNGNRHFTYYYGTAVYPLNMLRYARSVPIVVRAHAGPDITVACAPINGQGTAVHMNGTASEGEGLSYHWSAAGVSFDDDASPTPTGLFPLGTSSVTLEVRAGNLVSRDTVQVTVEDSTPPVLTLAPSPSLLWPPNHRLVSVDVAWQVTDRCDPSPRVSLVSVVSSEPDDAPGSGDGNTTGDIANPTAGMSDGTVLLRAERSGEGPGRTYTVAYVATNASGSASSAQAMVAVPHDLGTGPEPLLVSLEPDATQGTAHIYWNAVPGAEMYDVIQGDLSQVSQLNGKTWLGKVRVLASGQSETSYSEKPAGAIPPVGKAFFYLVQYRNGIGASGWGTESGPWAVEPTSCDIGCPGMASITPGGSTIAKRE